MRILRCLVLLVLVLRLVSCTDGADSRTGHSPSDSTADRGGWIPSKGFSGMRDSVPLGLFILRNGKGMEAAVTNYGGRLVGLRVPDANGRPTDVVLGLASVDDYAGASEPYFGATIGRYGNRLAKGRFVLDGKTYQISINNGKNTLHGGKKGFQSVMWMPKQVDDSTLELRYRSNDGEEGFPGKLEVKVIYQLGASNELRLTYEARTDQATVVNLTNHAFFNLNGEGSGTINGHLLQIDADSFTPVDSTLIPTGEVLKVEGTPFDFRSPHKIGERVDEQNEQLAYGKGYDHNFVLRGEAMKHAAQVIGDRSGIVMDIYTEEPGLQFYGGNFMQSKNRLKSGASDDFRTAFCLETQHFPDAPNHPAFASTVLRPGDTYRTFSIYRFSTKKPGRSK